MYGVGSTVGNSGSGTPLVIGQRAGVVVPPIEPPPETVPAGLTSETEALMTALPLMVIPAVLAVLSTRMLPREPSGTPLMMPPLSVSGRSEERRVGKGCGWR